MYLPLNWLKDYLEFIGTTDEVAQQLIQLGFEAEKIDEQRLDLEITPNRGDVLSMVGLAREYAALTDQRVTMPTVAELGKAEKLSGISLTADPAAYHRLAAITLNGVANQESPDWLKERLVSMGANSINLIVDLTNYVMYELGIPLHAFDHDDLPGQDLELRLSKAEEHFVSLKDEERALPAGLLVVESSQQIIDLLGVRGGKKGMIQPTSRNLLVWSASVPRPAIRKATKVLGIKTDASYRHERETDWAMVPLALARFVQLLEEITGQSVNKSGMIDWQATPYQVTAITIEPAIINQTLGTKLTEQEMIESLGRLGFIASGNQVTVPSWRQFDITNQYDLAEEIARILDYNQLPKKIIEPKTEATNLGQYGQIEGIKSLLASDGFTEVFTESFSSLKDTKALGLNLTDLNELANPVNLDYAVTRPSMSINHLKLLAANSWDDNLIIFEIGHVFPNQQEELVRICLAGYGNQTKRFANYLPNEKIKLIQPGDQLASELKIRRQVTVAEAALSQFIGKADLTNLWHAPAQRSSYRVVSPYPPSVRDLSVIVETIHDPETIKQKILESNQEHIILVELFDQYTSDSFGQNKQSLTYHVVYQDKEKSLATETVDRWHQATIDLITKSYRATIR